MQKMTPPAKLALSEEHARWIESVRKLPCEIAAAMGVVSDGKTVVFEYRRSGELLWRQYRYARSDGSKTFATFAPDGRTLKDAGIELSFWNEDELCGEPVDLDVPRDTPRIITEGQFDAIAFKAAGAPIVGSVPNGAVDRPGEGEVVPSEDHRFAYLWDGNRPRGALATCNTIILATDNDKAGRVLRDELALRLGRDRCWFVVYPPGCKDANEVLQKFGEAKGCDLLNEMIADARPVVPSQLGVYSKLPVVKREAVRCGWIDLDPHLKIVRPELMVITGPPGDGKSQFALALAANLAHEHGWGGAILQFEDDVERNREDLLANWRQRHGSKDREAATAWMDKHFVTIAPDESLEGRYDLPWLRRTLAEAAIRHRCKWVIIDPWNEVEHFWSKGQTETQYLNDALREIKKQARRYQLMVIIVTHPDKGSGRVTNIDDWDLYSISGGQAWNNKADHGVVVLREDRWDGDNLNAWIKISKSKRHATMGRPGTVLMRYVPVAASYEFVRRHEPKGD